MAKTKEGSAPVDEKLDGHRTAAEIIKIDTKEVTAVDIDNLIDLYPQVAMPLMVIVKDRQALEAQAEIKRLKGTRRTRKSPNG